MDKVEGKGNVEERKMVYNKRKKSTKKFLLITIAAIAIVCGGTLIVLLMTENDNGNPSNSNNGSFYETASEIFIPLSELDTKAQYFTFGSNGVDIHYFAVKDDNGNVHVALDACDVCYGAKKGYVQVGNMMQCRNCGNQFSITDIGTENIAGGCWPSYLPIRIDNETVVIKKSDLEEKRYMFE